MGTLVIRFVAEWGQWESALVFFEVINETHRRIGRFAMRRMTRDQGRSRTGLSSFGDFPRQH